MIEPARVRLNFFVSNIPFLQTPAVGEARTAMLIAALEHFRDHCEAESPLESVVSMLCRKARAAIQRLHAEEDRAGDARFYASNNGKVRLYTCVVKE